MKTLKAIILDFDGVIIESNGIKDNAFSEIFKEFPEYYEIMMQYHFSNNHLDRYHKFEYFVFKILGRNDEKLFRRLNQKFSFLTRDAVINCPFVPGALELLSEISGKIPLYLCSATPDKVLIEILKKRKLHKYFRGVFGSKNSKTEIIEKIIKEEHLLKDEVLYVGDSLEDLKTADELCINFIGRNAGRSIPDSKFPVLPELHSIHNYLINNYSY